MDNISTSVDFCFDFFVRHFFHFVSVFSLYCLPIQHCPAKQSQPQDVTPRNRNTNLKEDTPVSSKNRSASTLHQDLRVLLLSQQIIPGYVSCGQTTTTIEQKHRNTRAHTRSEKKPRPNWFASESKLWSACLQLGSFVFPAHTRRDEGSRSGRRRRDAPEEGFHATTPRAPRYLCIYWAWTK